MVESCGTAGSGSVVVTAASWVDAVEQIESLALELLHAGDVGAGAGGDS